MEFEKIVSFSCFTILIFFAIDFTFGQNNFSPKIRYHAAHPNVSLNYSYINLKHLKGYKLDVTPLATFSVNSRSRCARECLLTKGACQSFNTRLIPNGLECEILATDIYTISGKLVTDINSIHSLIANRCMKKPCFNEEKCIPNYLNNTFICKPASCNAIKKRNSSASSGFYNLGHDLYAEVNVYCNYQQQRDSKIMTPDLSYCLEPETGGCIVTDSTSIVYRRSLNFCGGVESIFNFIQDKGKLIHKCSSKPVCVQNGSLVVSSTCPDFKLARTFLDTIQSSLFANCLGPQNEELADGATVDMSSNCLSSINKLVLPSIVQGKVKTSMYWHEVWTIESAENHTSYPDSPTYSGYIDNLDTPLDIGERYFLRVQAYFKAPQTGVYYFYVQADNIAALYLSSDDKESNKQLIASVSYYTLYHVWNQIAEQKSQPVTLVAGKIYYIEGLLVEYGGNDNLAIAAELPDGTFLSPITNDYLQRLY